MVLIEIPVNPNCDPVDLRVFHDLEPPRPITHVLIEPPGSRGPAQWCAVTGWSLNGEACPALARKVDDSGEGVVLLVSGGDAGLRLQPAHRAARVGAPRQSSLAGSADESVEGRSPSTAPWRLDCSEQWGAPFLLLAEVGDVSSDS